MHKDSRKKSFLYKVLGIVPDSIYLWLKYYKNFHRFPNLRQPKLFTEKLQWLKLHDHNPEYTTMVDKYEAKKWVAARIGEEYIIKTLGVWDRAEDIDWESLPDKFVLKATHDSGRVVICTDKSRLDKQKTIEEMNESLKRDFYTVTREWPYKNVPKRIIAEEYLVDESGSELKDYKFFTFDGNVKFLKVDFGRFTNHRANYYNLDWNILDLEEVNYPNDKFQKIPMPPNFEKMVEIVNHLANGMKFLRVDLFNVNGKVYFGELTFFPDSGMGRFNPIEWDERLGKLVPIRGGVFD